MYEFLNATLEMLSSVSTNGSVLLHQPPAAVAATLASNDSWQLLPTFAEAVTEAATDWLRTFMATLAATTDGPDNMDVTAAEPTGNCNDTPAYRGSNNLCPNLYNNETNVTASLLSTVTAIAETATTLINTTLSDAIGIDGSSGADDGSAEDHKLFDWHNYSRCDPENPQFNCTPNEYVEFLLGPQRLPLYHVLMVTIIYGGIFITGILGNVLVCVVIVRHPTMHSATNYYLFSLAVSDLLYLLFGLPAEIFLYWHQYPYLFGLPFCKIRAFISEASTYVSVLTIVAFSMERFLAICHPLHLYTMSGFKRAVRIIATLWIISFISAIPFGLLTNIRYIHYPNDDSMIAESAFCSMEFSRFPWIELSFCVFFVIPMILISILYACMGKQIRLSATAQLGVQQGSMHRESSHSKSRKAVIRMLAAVVITFFICWLPFHIQRLWILYATSYDYFQDVNEWMFCITGFAYYVSCTINPILYNVMSHRYRVAFKDILCGKRRTVYFNYTFARDQSSFRETNSSTFDRGISVRVRSIRHSTNLKDHNCLTAANNTLWMKGGEKQAQNEETKPPPPPTSPHPTNIIVVVDNPANVNGRPKLYTEHEVKECLLRKDHETCI